MSVKKSIYTQLDGYLKTKMTFSSPSTLPSVKWIDRDTGQLQFLSEDFITFPAILIKFSRFDYKTTGNKTQQGLGTIRFTLIVQNFADSFEGSINQAKAIEYWDLVEELHKALQGVSGTGFTPLDRIAEPEEEVMGGLIVLPMEYATIITDDSADGSDNITLVDPALEVERVASVPAGDPPNDRFVV
jgi:hypothetical protein